MADFKIVGAVGLGGLVHRAGSEDQLARMAEDAEIDLRDERFKDAIKFEQQSDEPTGYAAKTVAELKAEVELRGLTVEGTGSGGNVVRKDLIKALEASDAE